MKLFVSGYRETDLRFVKKLFVRIALCITVLMVAVYPVRMHLIVPSGDIIPGGDTELDKANYAFAEQPVPDIIADGLFIEYFGVLPNNAG